MADNSNNSGGHSDSLKTMMREDLNTPTPNIPQQPQTFRNMITSQKDSRFTPEPNRYHLYVAHACPWSHRTTIVRNLKGLQKVIGITYVHPTWQYTKPDVDDHRGWVFGTAIPVVEKETQENFHPIEEDTEVSTTTSFFTSTSGKGSFPSSWGEQDVINHAKSIRELYELAIIAEQGQGTTSPSSSEGMQFTNAQNYVLPILWDKQEHTIVSNDSSEIIRMFNSEFNKYAIHSDLDLYPPDLANDIDATNAWIYPTINDGVYKCGLAFTQQEYDDAIDDLTQAFDRVESILKSQRYITGNRFTEADVRLFVTLIRWDEVYEVYFRCNSRSVRSSSTLLNYVRDIYQIPGVADTCRMDRIKAHYFTSHVEMNPFSIIPAGDDFEKELGKKSHHRGE